MATTKQIQLALNAKGFNCGTADGVMGRKTEIAIVQFKVANKLPANVKIDALTLKLLGLALVSATVSTPWLNEVGRYMGLHELRNKTALSTWLRSDKSSVGDPTKLPWCGDLVETAIKLTLPAEPFTGKVKANPYFATNWNDFGVKTEPCYGAVGVFVRPGGGHVGFIIGFDPVRKRYRLRNGNVSNTVCDSWIDASRCVGIRWPTTYKGPKQPLPILDSSGAVVSKNEA